MTLLPGLVPAGLRRLGELRERLAAARAAAGREAPQHPVERGTYRQVARLRIKRTQLVGITLQVVELASAGPVLHIQPARGSHGAVGHDASHGAGLAGVVIADRHVAPAARFMQQRPARASAGVPREGKQGTPVEPLSRPGRRGLEDGWRQIDVADQLVRLATRGDPGTPKQQGHPSGRLVRKHLAAGHVVFALHVSVVGSEQDVGVVELTGLSKGRDDPRDGVVHGQERLLTVAATRRNFVHRRRAERTVAAHELRLVRQLCLAERRRGWRDVVAEAPRIPWCGPDQVTAPMPNGRSLVMGREKGHRQEERTARRRAACDEVHGLTPVDVGLVETRILFEGRPVCVADAVLVQRVTPHLVGRPIDRSVPLGPARRHVRAHVGAVAVQVLADVRGCVAGVLQPDREGVPTVETTVAACRRIQTHDAVVMGVLAAHVGGPRRAAHWIRDIRIRERHTALTEKPARFGHHRHV